MDYLKTEGLYERCGRLESRYATDDEIKLCHDESYINSIKELKTKSQQELVEMTKNPNSVYYHWNTFECASLATGCLLSVVDAVCSKQVNLSIKSLEA